MLQGVLPLNPQQLPGMEWSLAFNTAMSFVTNTNWQAYSGEASLSYLSQMVGLTVQNFVSAATGLAVLVALCRGISRRSSHSLGNFWADMTRATLYALLPISIVLAVFLVWQGVPQNFAHYIDAIRTDPAKERSKPADGAGGEPLHQATGHQRRWLLRRQLGAPVRKPDGLEQPVRTGVDPADPGCAGVHLRPLRQGHAPERFSAACWPCC